MTVIYALSSCYDRSLDWHTILFMIASIAAMRGSLEFYCFSCWRAGIVQQNLM
jgi:hypothetical protein